MEHLLLRSRLHALQILRNKTHISFLTIVLVPFSDPESFVRVGPMQLWQIFSFFFSGRVDPNTTKSWRADYGPTFNAGSVSLCDFSGVPE